ncbi:MAG: bifunctional DNA-formamidopyrimidine glycosylase/DNA-(apurinic or apyrimidinic site) lyase [Planctomycetota bacterium]
MPELPEVETICRGLRKHAVGLKIRDVTVRMPKVTNVTAKELRKATIGATIKDVQRRAKTINIHLSNNLWMVIHLKISGQLLYLPKAEPVKEHTHIIFDLSNGYTLRFWDLRQFGYVRLFDKAGYRRFMDELGFGPEPLEKGFTLERFRQMLASKPGARIKPLLMDQTFISGIGNLYADEILFYARIHPLTRAGSLKESQVRNIYRGIKKILALGIKKRGSSVELYVDVEGRPGGFVPYIKAYGREGKPCKRCGTPIKRIKIGSRSASFCPKCQLEPVGVPAK